MVPPCINKFYILDLQPENSLVRYAVEQGNTVFLVSWRNPDQSLAHTTWDDYVDEGVVERHQRGQSHHQGRKSSIRSASAWAVPCCRPRWPCWRRAANSRPPASLC
jgi:hypothetical protein